MRPVLGGGLVVLLVSASVQAATFTINSEADLRTALNPTGGAQNGDTIAFNANITLSGGDLPVVQRNVTILGNSHTLSGANTYRGLLVYSGTVSISDLTIQDAKAKGGNGSLSGGGGGGLGGALFVASGASVTVSNVSLMANSAQGGNGGNGGGEGAGGGMGGNAGRGGGGLGSGATGGTVGSSTGGTGIALGAASGGNGASGGGGTGGASGGGGGNFGGGGGVGGGNAVGSAGAGWSGGDGGFGGGGGDGVGNGGFGGGGAGGTDTSQGGGDGGFGGGGGAGSSAIAGFAAGAGSSIHSGRGGGGAGLGGAIFVQEGGSLVLAGPLAVNGGSVSGGTAGAGASSGSSFGGGLFLQGNGTLTFEPAAGDTQTVADAIADQTGSGGTGANAGSWSLTKAGTGTLTISGANTYTGGATINAGTLTASSDGNLGNTAGGLTFGGGTLRYGAGFSSARSVTLNAGGGTFDTNGTDATLSGVLSGTGGLTKSGTGTLTLSGANTYSGGTTINAGTLTASSDGNLGNTAGGLTFGGGTLRYGSGFSSARSVTLNAGGGTFDTNGTDATLSGVLSGTGGLTKAGTGGLTLSGTNTYTGGTTISGGILSVNGSLASGVTVNTGGTFGGTGTITGLVTANGTLAPGNSIGTLTVTGNLTFGSGSVYEVEVNAAGESDLTQVSGTATLTGARVSALPAAGTYQRGTTRYTILTAGSLAGTFDSVTSSLAFLSPSLSYTATSVFLDLLRTGNYTSAAQTENQTAVAEALDRAYTTASGDFLTVTNELDQLSAAQARTAFTSMSGQVYGTLATIGVTTGTVFNRTLAGRIGQVQAGEGRALTGLAFSGLQLAAADTGVLRDTGLLGGGAMPGLDKEPDGPQGWWVRGYGVSGDLDGDGNATGTRYHLAGAGTGYDRRVTDQLLLGVSGAFIETHADLDELTQSARVKSWQAAAYGSYAEGPVTVKGIARYGYNQYQTSRSLSFGTINRTATGDADGHEVSLYAEGAYAIPTAWLTIQPIVALQYLRLYQGAVTEEGADSLNLDVNSQTSHYLRLLLGPRLSRVLPVGTGKVTVEARALWSHELGDTDAAVTGRFAGAEAGGSFTVQGVRLAKNGAVLGAGAMATLTAALSGYLDYNAELRSNQIEHQAVAGLRWSW